MIKNIFKIQSFSIVPLLLTLTVAAYIRGQEPSSTQIYKSTEAQRADAEKQANAMGQNIKSLVEAGKFQDAEKLFDKIFQIYSALGNTKQISLKLSLLQTEKTMFYKNWADYLEKQATSAYLKKEWDKSIALSKQSMDVMEKIKANNHATTVTQKGIMSRSSAAVDNENFIKTTAIDSTLPEYKYRIKDLEDAINKAQVYMKQKEYKKAKGSLEEALLLDPYNYKAMNMLNMLYTNLLDVAKARNQEEKIKAMAQVQWLNNEPVSPEIADKDTLVVKEVKSEKSSKIKEKLENIILNKIDFDNATISSVLTHLNRESKILDTSDEHNGINIILKLSSTQKEPKLVTVQFDDIPIGETIKYICLATGLKYRIEDQAVIIGDGSIEEMETCFYQTQSGLINSIVTNLNPIKTDITGEGNKKFYDPKKFAKEDSLPQQNVTSAQLMDYFKQRGVPFPQGSSIAWDSKTSILIVTNTPDNQKIINSLIKEIDIQIPLVLIETKFVEITENELEELSFKWRFHSKGRQGEINPFNLQPNQALPAIWGNDPLVRPYTNDAGEEEGALINNLTYTAGGTTVNFWLYALDQSKTAEVLSSPKVTTKSGSKAIIKMVTDAYYPQTWSIPTVNTSGATPTFNVGIPTFGDPTDLGIMLEVTPTVSPNNHTILLDLKPQVVNFEGWIDYPYKVTYSTFTDTTITQVTTVPAKMAKISHRDVNTTVKVYDGETVVLGGTIKENGVYVNDEMPILGDIPLFGRLFKSQYEKKERKNLLIFVTARLVSPDGKPLRKQINGLFDFGR